MAQVRRDEALLDRYPHQLSGGQRQRAAIARALIAAPDLIVADEPTSMLGATVAAGILQLLRHLRRVGNTTFVFITHDLAQAVALCDRIGVMHQGKLVEVGAPEALCAEPHSGATRELLAAARARQAPLKDPGRRPAVGAGT